MSLGHRVYMKRYNLEEHHLNRLEKERHKIEAKQKKEADRMDDVAIGYRNYISKLVKQNKRERKKKEKLEEILEKLAEREREHHRKHMMFKDPNHSHTPRENYRGALEDGKEEKFVICTKEYRRLMNEISGVLNQAIEIVKVVVNTKSVAYDENLKIYLLDTLVGYLDYLLKIKTFDNWEIVTYQRSAINQIHHTIIQLQDLFSQLESESRANQPKAYKLQQDRINKWGDTKYSREKYKKRPGLAIPPELPIQYYIPGEGFRNAYLNRKNHPGHGTHHPHPVHHHSSIQKYQN